MCPAISPVAPSPTCRCPHAVHRCPSVDSGLTKEQVRWLEAICDHIAGSVSMEMGDFQYAPFNQQGGLGKAYELFGDELPSLLEELNLELVA